VAASRQARGSPLGANYTNCSIRVGAKLRF
jgi:hypothetical protein